MRISIELVPRSIESLQEEINTLVKYPAITAVNIPDLLKFTLRSWDGVLAAQSAGFSGIPHLRAIDFDLNSKWELEDFILENKIKEVLVVNGDLPQDMNKTTYNTSSIKMIERLKHNNPALKVYAAIDPYRSGIRDELEYIDQKLSAGADGFLTQPFFDMRLIEIYGENLAGVKVLWGVSPVTSDKSRSYWECRNRAVFPKDFQPTIKWNADFTRKVMTYCEANNFDLYLMPIKIGLDVYLQSIWG